MLNRPHSITATVEIPEGGAEGVLLAQGSAAGGYSLLHQGRPAALRPQLRRPRDLRRHVRGPVPAGSHELRFEFEPTGEPDLAHGHGAPGRLQLYIDGKLVGNAEAPMTTPFVFNPGAPRGGLNPGSPVTPDYARPFRFTGTIHNVTVDVSGELIVDQEAELRAHMARQ